MRVTISHAPLSASATERLDISYATLASDGINSLQIMAFDAATLRALAALCTRAADKVDAIQSAEAA